MTRISSILLSALFLVTFAGTASAQQVGGQTPFGMRPQMGGSPQMGGAPGGAPGAPGPQTMHIEGELAFLKAELKITDSQSKKWDAFADSVRQGIKNVQTVTSQAQPSTTHGILDTMSMREKYLKARSDALSGLLDKFKPLYDSFSDEQKTSADQLIPAHLAMAL